METLFCGAPRACQQRSPQELRRTPRAVREAGPSRRPADPPGTKKSPSGGFAAGEPPRRDEARLTPQKPVSAVKREPSVE